VETAVLVVHLLAAAVWVGGTVALVFVGVPVIRLLEGADRARLLRELGRRWRPIGWGALGVLVATGIVRAGEIGAFTDARPAFDAVFVVKISLFCGLVLLSYLHDYRLGPGLARQIRAGEQETLRRPLVLVGWTTFALTVVIPVLGVILTRLD
jgi:putative copper export protein